MGTAVTQHVRKEKEIDYDLLSPDQSSQTFQQGTESKVSSLVPVLILCSTFPSSASLEIHPQRMSASVPVSRTIATPTSPAAEGLGFCFFRVAPVLRSGFWVPPHPSPPPLTSISAQAEASEAVPVRALLAASHHVAYRHFSRCSALQNPRNPSQEKYSVEISTRAQPTSNTAEPEPVRTQASKRQAGK